MEKLYKVVFKGEIVEGKARDTVQQDLATLLRIDPEKAARLFSGRPVVIGKNLPHSKAVRHLSALDGAGAVGHIEPMAAVADAPRSPARPVSLAKPGSTRTTATPAPASRAVSPDTNVGKTCLKCGHVRKAGDPPPDIECPACHAIYARVEEARRKQAEQQPVRARTLRIGNPNDTWSLPRPVGFKGWLRRGLAWTFGVLFLLTGLMVTLTSPLAALLALTLGALLLPPIRAFVHGRTGVSLRPFKAILPCERVLPRMAKYDYEWTDGWLEFKFPRFRWHDRDRGSLTYIGDKARFQSGFGAWQNVIYECDYDPATEQVLDFRVRPGRFSG